MYYLWGVFNNEISIFNKNIEVSVWNRLLNKSTIVRSSKYLKYYTDSRCFIKQGDRIFMEDTQDYSLENSKILCVRNKKQPVDYFPLQLKYNNKQKCYTRVADNGLIFTEYVENGKTYREISSQSVESLDSLE